VNPVFTVVTWHCPVVAIDWFTTYSARILYRSRIHAVTVICLPRKSHHKLLSTDESKVTFYVDAMSWSDITPSLCLHIQKLEIKNLHWCVFSLARKNPCWLKNSTICVPCVISCLHVQCLHFDNRKLISSLYHYKANMKFECAKIVLALSAIIIVTYAVTIICLPRKSHHKQSAVCMYNVYILTTGSWYF
jgi:hypothetical protein